MDNLKDPTQYIVVTLNNGAKFVPLQQAEAIRRERDELLMANKNLRTMLNMYQRCNHVDNGTK